jgi:hypothetical protein
MRKELPKKWMIIYRNKEEFNIINYHFRKRWGYMESNDEILLGYFSNDENDKRINNNWIGGSGVSPNYSELLSRGWEPLTWEEFEVLVLKQENTYKKISYKIY